MIRLTGWEILDVYLWEDEGGTNVTTVSAIKWFGELVVTVLIILPWLACLVLEEDEEDEEEQ